MKPYKEERTGLKIDLRAVSFFIGALLLTQNIYPQIPINGFCKYNSVQIDSGYNSFFTLNYNGDSYADLFLYNSNNKKSVSLLGDINGSFLKDNSFELPFEISKLHSIARKDGSIKEYAYSSRKSRQVGVLKFNEKGKPEIISRLQLKSYPENLSLGDIDNNGELEMLISGSSFEGLSLILFKDDKLIEKKIIDKSIYSSAALTDLSGDGYLDIASYNVISNSINFFYNVGGSNFKKVRSIPQTEKIFSLASADLNFDYNPDLIFTNKFSINILYGDFSSSYKKSLTLKTKNFPDKIIFGDFNKDGKIDIAYADFKESTFSIFFAKDEFQFYPEMVYLKSGGIKDIIPYYSKFIDGIALLSGEGKIITVTNLASVSEGADLAVGVSPSSIKYFDLNNNGIIDIAYFDNYTSTLNLIIRNNAGIPSIVYVSKMRQNHDEILIDNTLPNTKTFFCYSLGEKLIEVFEINVDANKITRSDLYSPGNIKDLKFKRTDQTFNLYTAYVKEGWLGAAIFENKDSRYYLNDYPNIISNLQSANISINPQPSIYAWNNNKDSLLLSIIKIGDRNKSCEIISSLNSKAQINSAFLEDLFYKNKNILLSFFKLDNQKKAMVSSKEVSNNYQNIKLANLFSEQGINKYFYGENRFGGLKKLFIYNSERNFINKIDFINGGKNMVITKIADKINLESFFIKNMNSKNYHLIYINNLNSCITIKKL